MSGSFFTKLALTFYLASSAIWAQSNSQNITNGSGNIQSQGVGNKVEVHNGGDYPTSTAQKDLAAGDYKDLVFEEKNKEKAKPARKKVLIITATNYETNILHEEAKKQGFTPEKEVLHDHIVYSLGNIGGVDVVQMQPGMMGMLEPSSTPLVLMSVFREVAPQYVIATGIAFGRQSKGQKLGDILVSRQVVNYETRKAANNDIIFRGDKVTCPMLERANAAINSWKGVKIHQGLVLSGNTLVNSKEFLAQLEKREPEYVGGDMEAYGAYAVASMMKAQWIMIKGISDWGDGSKNDDFHKIALQNACDFILHLIKEGNLA